ncbi:transposase [Synechococcus sp. R6-5]|jgi:hypothetical protein|uniref:IS701 family transposase n=1 Tax=Synechococcus sp. R6-5 TaxID=2421326 RepID=UPI0039C0168D
MNPPKCDDLDYIHFLIAAQKVFTCTEAARCAPEGAHPPAHDAFTRLLSRQPPDTEALWREAQAFVDRQRGLLVLDDTTLDKPYARQMELVTFHWSGKQRRVVQGIALMTLLWTQGQALLPCDFRVYDKPAGGQSKNQHFREMLQTAHGRGFRPAYVLMDSWYASLENLKQIAALGWRFLTRLKHNRLVNPDGRGNRPIEAVAIPPEGRVVHLKGFGFVQVFRTVSRDGDAEYWATNDLQMEEGKRAELERQGWGIEVYHRALKQCCGVERAQVRKAVAILGHLHLALRAFLRLEVYRLRTGVSWYEAKAAIVRDAIRHYLAHPIHTLQPTA